MNQKLRPWIAAALSVVYPGLGHLYLRAWLRAVGWFVFAILTVWWLIQTGAIPQSALTAFEQGGFDALVSASRDIGAGALLPLFVVRVFNVVDAVIVARRQNAQRASVSTGRVAGGTAGSRSPSDRAASGLGLGGDDRPDTCPACGRELDPELDFCPWCTTRLDDERGDRDGDGGGGATSR